MDLNRQLKKLDSSVNKLGYSISKPGKSELSYVHPF